MAALEKINPSVSRWVPLLEQYRGAIPLSFLLYVIQTESDGIPSTNYYGAKGLGQLNDTELKMIGFDPARTLTDGAYSLAALLAFLDKIAIPRADAAIAKHGLGWHPDDPETRASYWALVKMVHAWPAGLDVFPARFKAAKGRPPGTILELMLWVRENADDLAARPFPEEPTARWTVKDLITVGPNVLRAVQGLEPGAEPYVLPPTTSPRREPPKAGAGGAGPALGFALVAAVTSLVVHRLVSR